MSLTLINYQPATSGDNLMISANITKKSRPQSFTVHQYAPVNGPSTSATARQHPPSSSSSTPSMHPSFSSSSSNPSSMHPLRYQRPVVDTAVQQPHSFIQTKKAIKRPYRLIPDEVSDNAMAAGQQHFKKANLKTLMNENNSNSSFPIVNYNTGLVINKIPAVIKPVVQSTPEDTPEAQGKFGQLPKTQLTMRSMNTQNSIQQRQSPPSSWSSVEGGRKEALFCKLPANLTIKPAFQKESTSMTSARKRCSGFAEEASSDQKQTMPTHPTFRTKSINHEKPCTLILSPLATKRAAVTEKSDLSKRSIRSITIELIERNPALHLGVSREYLPVLKDTICKMAGVELTDMYLTIKKLKHNEDFALLGEYFEMKETTVQEVFTRSLVKLARYMRYLAMWPSDQSYYTRHKNVPLHFRRNMTNVQSVVECVETDMRTPLHVDCCNFKFILCINTSSIITYISDAYIGHYDDLVIFNASNFKSAIPKCLNLTANPGVAMRRFPRKSLLDNTPPERTLNEEQLKSSKLRKDEKLYKGAECYCDTNELEQQQTPVTSIQMSEYESVESLPLNKYIATRIAGELLPHKDLSVVNDEVVSKRMPNLKLSTMEVEEPVCRQQIREVIYALRSFKVLQRQAIMEPLLFQYLNEVLLVVAGLYNLQC